MLKTDPIIDELVLAFRERLLAAIDTMQEARDALSFAASEREVVGLAREMAAELTPSYADPHPWWPDDPRQNTVREQSTSWRS